MDLGSKPGTPRQVADGLRAGWDRTGRPMHPG
jgi:hypothetical protein